MKNASAEERTNQQPGEPINGRTTLVDLLEIVGISQRLIDTKNMFGVRYD